MVELINGMMVGGYRLVTLLQDGGDGRQVFLAHELADENRRAVVKVAPHCGPQDKSRLNREFTVLRQVACDGVVAALGHGVAASDGIDYLILSHHGPSLAAVLAASPNQSLPIESALAMTYAAASAVGQLHLLGWCHGDLKPGNLLCDPRGKLVLSDLEFAARIPDRALEPDPDFALAGTPPFMAPELWGDQPAGKSAASDVWALGVTLYLSIFGEYPFGHGDPEEIQSAIARRTPPRYEELPEPLYELLRVFLAPNPKNRWTDGRQAAAAIARTITQLGLYLSAGREAFAHLVATTSELSSPVGISSTIRRPDLDDSSELPPLQPKTEVGLPSPPTPQRMPTPPPPRAPREVEGVGAGGSSIDRGVLERYFDIASRAAAALATPGGSAKPAAPLNVPTTMTPTTPAPAAAPAATPKDPSPTSAPSTVQNRLSRRAAARWYRRMNPDRNFPLSVVLSGKEIRIVGGSGLGITLGAKEIVIDPDDPVLSIEPSFPGCLVSPPRADVHCSQDTTTCRFWITPLVCDDLKEACVTIRYRGQIVETLPTPTKVVTRTTAKVLATFGLISPIAGKALHIAGWNPDQILRQSLPYAADLVQRMGLVSTGLILTSVFLAAAFGYYYVTRPLLSEDPEPQLLASAP